MRLIDTCEIIRLFEDKQEKELLNSDIAVCSFNEEELLYLEHRHKIDVRLRHKMKKFFVDNKIPIIPVPVTPGQRKEEKRYVDSVNKNLLRLIPDPSDAVLAACALQHNANIVTRDRHHLYTAKLENLFQENGISVSKKI